MSLARPIHYETHHVQPGPLPAMTTPNNNNPPPAPYAFDAARTRSLNGASPPHPYGTTAHPPPRLKHLVTPPPSFCSS